MTPWVAHSSCTIGSLQLGNKLLFYWTCSSISLFQHPEKRALHSRPQKCMTHGVCDTTKLWRHNVLVGHREGGNIGIMTSRGPARAPMPKFREGQSTLGSRILKVWEDENAPRNRGRRVTGVPWANSACVLTGVRNCAVSARRSGDSSLRGNCRAAAWKGPVSSSRKHFLFSLFYEFRAISVFDPSYGSTPMLRNAFNLDCAGQKIKRVNL